MTDSDKRANMMSRVLDNIHGNFSGLYSRWLDEGEKYEGFDIYEKFLRSYITRIYGDEMVFIKGTKRPFGFIVQPNGFPWKVHIFINSREYGWKSVTK